jgi:DNA-binding transcriptional ArsR family regulator
MAAKKQTELDQRLVKAMGHPLRHRILSLLNEKVASPVEIARELDEPLGNVSYHVRILHQLKCVELVRTTPRRGAVEHHYRAVMRSFFDDEQWAQLPATARQGISDGVLRKSWDDVAAAVEAGSFDRRTDRHLSRTALALDDQAYGELNTLLLEVMERAIELQAEAADRQVTNGDGGQPLNTRLVIMHFESAESAGRRGDGGRARAKRKPARRRAASR